VVKRGRYPARKRRERITGGDSFGQQKPPKA
jgi:hypothetical protein